MADGKDSVVDYVKQEELLAMYRSVDRMNHHMVDGNSDSAFGEQHLQQNIRQKFRDLQSRQGIETEL